MIPRRLRSIVIVALLTLIASSCERLDVGPQLAGELNRAREGARTVMIVAGDSARAEHADSATVLAALYLERHRLGLGSPFRLIDHALTDPRLRLEDRRRIAWMLLARTLDGAGHAIDAPALEALATRGQLTPEAGELHLTLIQRAITGARDPRAGEQAVRVAYAVAAAEGVASPVSGGIATRAAAILRDRAIASSDARTLLRAARGQGSDPLALIPLWRSARRFEVERPAMVSLSPDAEREALELVPGLVAALRGIGEQLHRAALDTLRDSTETRHTYHLSAGMARRLGEIAWAAELPPQAPVVVAVKANRGRLLDRSDVAGGARRSRVRFLMRAQNEETLAAEYAVLRQDSLTRPTAPALTVLTAAVTLRAYAQEEVWWPGMPGPSPRDLRDRYGLAALTFDDDVPQHWRGYYTRMLSLALSDMQRVMPSLRLRGLAIHFGESPMRSEALAMHEPRRRIVYLPLATSAGALAHEIAHDLDWQVARTRYGSRGEYASDRAIRDREGSSLATALQGLTSATLIPPLRENNHRPPHDNRPAEVFARSVDWFVAVALAREGRSNGYLSSVQDDALTGYVTVSAPDVTGSAGEALVRLLDDVAPVATASREWFLANYGSSRSQGSYDLVRKVLEQPLPASGHSQGELRLQLAAVGEGLQRALQAINDEACRSRGDYDDRRLAVARTRVASLAAEARARGLILNAFAARVAEEGGRFALQQSLLGGALPLAPFDPLPSELVQSMIDQARMLEQVQRPVGSQVRPRGRCALPVPQGGRHISAD